MMRPSHLAAQGAGALAAVLRETADSFAAGIELLGLALYWLWLHLVLGASLIARLALTALKSSRGDAPRRPRR